MRIILFSSQNYDRESFLAANPGHGFELHFQQSPLRPDRSSTTTSRGRCWSNWRPAARG